MFIKRPLVTIKYKEKLFYLIYIDSARLKNMLVCRYPGLFFRVHPTGRKVFFYHFEMEKITLILIYDILVTKKFFSAMNIKKIF